MNGSLSPRLQQIARLLYDGKSNKEIAYALGVSTTTVVRELRALYKALGARNRLEAVLRIYRESEAK